MKVAFFGAHPDDIELCMGGTMIKYKEQGHEVYMVIATDGSRGAATPEETGPKLAALRKREACNSAAHIGIEPIFLEFEDHRLVFDRQAYDKFAETIAMINPDVVFTHDPADYHSDHRITSQLVTSVSYVPVFLCDTKMCINFEPQFYVDITAEFDLKVRMVREHVSQDPDMLLESRELQNRFRGAQCGRKEIRYAEAFRLYPRNAWVRGHTLLPK